MIQFIGCSQVDRDCRGRDRMVVEFTTTCAISAYHHKVVSSKPVYGEVHSIQHYVIKFNSDLRQVGGFLQGLSGFHTFNQFVNNICVTKWK
jgi:hypothetical protein